MYSTTMDHEIMTEAQGTRARRSLVLTGSQAGLLKHTPKQSAQSTASRSGGRPATRAAR
jgi:hypothetical protein